MTRSRPRADDRSLGTARLLVDWLLLAVVAIGLGGVVLGRVLPAIGAPVLVVAGPSMTPAIPVGSAVVLEPIDPASLAVGDVVSLKSGPARATFTHRIVRLVPRDDGLWLETKGDANERPDPSLTPARAVIGRVAITIPGAGFALTVLSAPAGVVFILSTGVLLITAGWALDGAVADRRRPPAVPSSAPDALSRTTFARAALQPSRIALVGVVPARTFVAGMALQPSRTGLVGVVPAPVGAGATATVTDAPRRSGKTRRPEGSRRSATPRRAPATSPEHGRAAAGTRRRTSSA